MSNTEEYAEKLSNRNWSLFLHILPEEWYNFEPDDLWTDEEFVKLAADESWNLDEMNEQGYCALKRMLYRIVVPKERWDDITKEEFFDLLYRKYKEQNK